MPGKWKDGYDGVVVFYAVLLFKAQLFVYIMGYSDNFFVIVFCWGSGDLKP